MSAEPVPYITEQEYLHGEMQAETKHEYGDGIVYAVADASDTHELVSTSFLGALHGHRRGKGGRVYKSDMKVRLSYFNKSYDRYPDVFVACDPTDDHQYYRERPKLLIEVLSDGWDDAAFAKFITYRAIATVEEIVFADPIAESPVVYLSRRADGWEPAEIASGMGAEFTLRSVGLTLKVSELFAF